jgi:ABC-2 type transport system ATP-binding protein
MIKIKNLKKVYKQVTVLEIYELDVLRSESFGLVGNNGAGKTTLFRILLDLVRATEGAVFIDDFDVSKDENWKKRVGSYLDEHMLLAYLTPTEYFDTLRKIYEMSEVDLEQHLAKFDGFFNDEILGKNKYIRNLSKGNLKKVGIAAALMGHPDIVILDEPFENLDPSSQVRLKKLIEAEKISNNTTFLISSHDLTHVTEICDRIVLLEKGKIIKDMKDSKENMTAVLHDYFVGR